MKKWSILFAIASLLVVAGCGDDNNNGNEENLPRCGNGIIEGTEQCDDSNHLNNDGCNDKCEIETCPMINSACDGSQIDTMCCDGEIYACMHDFWVPTECYTKCYADECDIICTAETEHYPTGGCRYRFSPQSVCNDGFISFPYTRSSSCEFLLSMCGNGIVEEIYEQCDDGNTVDGDGCSSSCRTETPSTPSNPVCGDGKKEGTEQCDDGNTVDGDGCSSSCQNESPAVSPCPVDGSGCTEWLENMCCDGKLYYCDALDNKWHMQECLAGTVCDTVAVNFGSDYPDHLSQCVESCDATEDGKVIDYGAICYTDNSFDLYVCQKSITGNYRAFRGTDYALAYCVDESHKAICNGETVEEVTCESCQITTTPEFTDAVCENISVETTPSVGDRCSEEDEGTEVCGQNNTRLECTEGTYELIESCTNLGENYYCDVKADDEFVACVTPCEASQKGQVTGYSDCLFGYVMVNTCELGKSGQYGSFGGLAGEQVCALDGTKLMTCDDNNAFVETPCAAACNMTWDEQESVYFASCQ